MNIVFIETLLVRSINACRFTMDTVPQWNPGGDVMLKTTLLNVRMVVFLLALVTVVELSTAPGFFGDVTAERAGTHTTDVQRTTKIRHEAVWPGF